jgi:hypothetical protein
LKGDANVLNTDADGFTQPYCRDHASSSKIEDMPTTYVVVLAYFGGSDVAFF